MALMKTLQHCMLAHFAGVRAPLFAFHLQVQISCVSNIVAWFCMWLLWIGTWLHQWHPVIMPLNLANANAESGAHH